MSKIEDFIRAAMKYKGDKYSQSRRMEKGFSDCSSLVYKALRDSGNLDLTKTTRTITTKYMKEGDPRFFEIPKRDCRRGDILWGGNYKNNKWDGHVAIYLGDGKTLEARYNSSSPGGVCIYVNRDYFTRAYRIKALAEEKQGFRKDKYVPVIVRGKAVKSAILIDDVSYITVKGVNVSVRDFFETLGMTVTWKDRKIYAD